MAFRVQLRIPLGPVVTATGTWFRERPRVAWAAMAVAVLSSWVAVAAIAWFTWDLLETIPNRDSLRQVGEMAQATTIFDAEDRAVFTVFRERRIEIPLDKVSPLLIQALLAIEDQRFYEHRGVDVVRVAGSAMANLREGRRAQGGSTITQQLARQSFLTPDKTLRRKLKEVILAAELEAEYSKREILELYLNKVYFGDGLYGVEAASLGYFAVHASELALPQAALLAGLVKSPSSWAPNVNPERAKSRRNLVLQAMADAGVVSREDAEAASAQPVALQDGLPRLEPHGAYYKEEVRRELVARFGLERVYEGGLQVFTTYDPELQKAAETAVADTLAVIETQRRSKELPESEDAPLQGALVAMDAATGHVRALVGGRDFDASHFNRAVQARRQPGSAFKPFVYAAALEAGWGPATIIDQLDEPVPTLQGDWIPEEGHTGAASMTLRSALRTSSNRAAVRLLEAVGIPSTVEYAERVGFGAVPRVPSLALGSGEVTLQDLTAAYGAFASMGIHRPPMLIRRVEDRSGELLYEAEPRERRVLSEQSAFLVTSMLADVINGGTGWKVRRDGFLLPAAGKTGTTNDYVDAWFVGFTRTLVAGVWIGFDQPQTILPGGYAGDLTVPLWTQFMKAATKGDRPSWYSVPRGLVAVEACRLTGLLPNVGCGRVEVVNGDGEVTERSMLYTEYFPRGRTPTEMCPMHGGESFLRKFAGIFKRQDGPPPVPASEARVPERPEPAAEVEEAEEAPEEREEPEQAEDGKKKKRGFWSRLFGIGGNAKDDRKHEPDDDAEERERPQRP